MKTALLFGSSGLIGGHLLNELIKNNKYSKVKLFVRLKPEINDSKIEIIKTNFNNLKNHAEDIKGDDCFYCIGTTKKNSPDKNEYKRVERDIPVEIAQFAKKNLVNSFIYVSSGFADPKNSGSYLRYKGEVEEELKNLNFTKLAIIRPSLLVGNRKSFRLGEVIFTPIMNTLATFAFGSLKKYKPIKIESVVKAIIYISENDSKEIIFESDELERIAKSN